MHQIQHTHTLDQRLSPWRPVSSYIRDSGICRSPKTTHSLLQNSVFLHKMHYTRRKQRPILKKVYDFKPNMMKKKYRKKLQTDLVSLVVMGHAFDLEVMMFLNHSILCIFLYHFFSFENQIKAKLKYTLMNKQSVELFLTIQQKCEKTHKDKDSQSHISLTLK